MTKETIVSILKEISSNFSSSYSKDDDRHVLMFNVNNNETPFSIETKGGIIYCNCVRIDDTKLIDFINDGKIIAIIDYSFIEKIKLL